MDSISPYFKSIVGALVAGLSVLATSLDNGELNSQECIYAAIAFLTALVTVFAVPNLDPKGRKQSESVQPPTRGGGLGHDRP